MPLPSPTIDVSPQVEGLLAQVSARQCAPPRASYRLQFHRGFGFIDAARIVDYLAELGVSHLYLSPVLQARPGSEHGYDLCDFGRFDDALGGDEGFQHFADAARHAGLALLVDFVPNHMAAHEANPWWRDVLENGRNSPFAEFFDIDRTLCHPELAEKVLLPLLGRSYGSALEAGELQIEHAAGEFWLRVGEHRLPLEPKTTALLLARGLAPDSRQGLGEDNCAELESILTALEHLPDQTASDPASISERQREKEIIKRRLAALESNASIGERIAANLAWFNGGNDEPDPWAPLDGLLQGQPYRLSHWRTAADEINYRRFFDVNDLAAICMERPDVFHAAHARLLAEWARGNIAGLRIDHVDGLFAPETYLWRLQWAALGALAREGFPTETADGVRQAVVEVGRALDWPAPSGDNLEAACGRSGEASSIDASIEPTAPTPSTRAGSIARLLLPAWVEKILAFNEPLPASWPTSGSTGYEFIRLSDGLFLCPEGWEQLGRLYRRITDDPRSFDEIARESKALVLRTTMASELQMLAQRLDRMFEQDRHTRDFTLNMLRHALLEVLACFSVYRVYPTAEQLDRSGADLVQRAVAMAKRRSPTVASEVFNALRDVLLLQTPAHATEAQLRDRAVFAQRFQQVASPVMAKGVEDTAFYAHVPLASVNEVGNDPRRPLANVDEFHARCFDQQRQWPAALLASTTHDTKRTEDVRARLHCLSEAPQLWRKHVQRWFRLNRRLRGDVDGAVAPSPADEYLFYQSLVGIWPAERPTAEEQAALMARLQQYMDKASHEAKQHTSWINPEGRYDEALRHFIERALRRERNAFLDDVQDFVARLAPWGYLSSLGQLVLKQTAPGVPDVYQGQELWDFSLVDPDNRRPVDFERRRALLGELRELDAAPERAAATVAEWSPGDDRVKLWVTWKLLMLRRSRPSLFAEGKYVPLQVSGEAAEYVVAFARVATGAERNEALVVVVPRLALVRAQKVATGGWPSPIFVRTAEFWGETTLALSQLCDVLGEPSLALENVLLNARRPGARQHRVAELLREFSVGVFAWRRP